MRKTTSDKQQQVGETGILSSSSAAAPSKTLLNGRSQIPVGGGGAGCEQQRLPNHHHHHHHRRPRHLSSSTASAAASPSPAPKTVAAEVTYSKLIAGHLQMARSVLVDIMDMVLHCTVALPGLHVKRQKYVISGKNLFYV